MVFDVQYTVAQPLLSCEGCINCVVSEACNAITVRKTERGIPAKSGAYASAKCLKATFHRFPQSYIHYPAIKIWKQSARAYKLSHAVPERCRRDVLGVDVIASPFSRH